MSQLVKAINAHDTNRKEEVQFALSDRLKAVLHIGSVFGASITNRTRTYKICIRLSSKFTVSEYALLKGKIDLVELGKEKIKQEIIEAIFGEFREDFLKLKRALHEYQEPWSRNEKALEILKEFETKMFSEE